jgi:hypothetical protein
LAAVGVLLLLHTKLIAMKRVITLSLIVFFALNASAQFTKGNKVLGFGFNTGQFSNNTISTNTSQETKGFGLNGSLSFAKAKSETRLNGFVFNAGYTKSISKNSNPFSNDQLTENYMAGVGYFIRKYKSLGKNFFVFGEAQGEVSFDRYISRSSTFYTNANQYQAGIGIYPGLAYKWNNRFLFELRFADFARVGYSYSERKQETTSDYSRSFSFGTSLGLGYLNNIGIGARWIIK